MYGQAEDLCESRAISSAVPFMMVLGRLSGPLAFLIFRSLSSFCTPGTSICMSCISGTFSLGTVVNVFSVFLVKTELNCWFSISTFDLSSLCSLSLSFKGTTPTLNSH